MGDPHLDAVTMGEARFDEVVTALNETVTAAIQRQVDMWVCLGDLFDPDAGPVAYRAVEAMLRVAWRLRLAGVRQAWVAGNHDVIEDGTGTTTLSPLRAMAEQFPADVLLFERPGGARLLGLPPLVALPYTATSHAYDPAALVQQLRADTRPAIYVGHLVVPGVTPGEEAVEYARGRDVFFPVDATQDALLRLNGHHHARGVSPDGVVIPGSLARLTYGERRNDPGFLVLDVAAG